MTLWRSAVARFVFSSAAIMWGGMPLGGSLRAEKPFEWPALEAKASWQKVPGGDRDAVLIASIERYSYYPNDPIVGAHKNAEAWYDYFHKARGIPIERITLLRDVQVTKSRLARHVQQLAKEVPKGGIAWFVFIGHGAPSRDGKDALLITLNAQPAPDSIAEESITRAFVENTLSGSEAGKAVLVLDTCFSGTGTSGKALAQGLQTFEWQAEPNAPSAAKLVVLTAASAGQYAGALPGSQRPAFSYLALAALSGWGRESPGPVTARDVWSFSRLWMRKLVDGREQTPTLRGDGGFVMGIGAEKGLSLSMVIPRVRPPTYAPHPANVPVAIGMDPKPAHPSYVVSPEVRVAEALQAAKNAERDRADPARIVEAWESLAKMKDHNPHIAMAAQKAAEWRAMVASQQALIELARKEWHELQRILALDVVSSEEKRERLTRFRRAYGRVAEFGEGIRTASERLLGCLKGAVLVPGGSLDSPSGKKTRVPDVCFDRYEVSAEDYRACVEGGKCSPAQSQFVTCNYGRADRAKHPINCVDWQQAKIYCEARGARLPTEEEWEWAARGGAEARSYPWGSQSPHASLLNACGSECRLSARTAEGWLTLHKGSDGHVYTAPVGSFPAGVSAHGIHDLSGNVAEWLGTIDPQEPSLRSVGGGSFLSTKAALVSARHRDSRSASSRADNLGFRCVVGR
jgi:formylglycine-generating enzyme required for sulfatase activity